MLSAIHDKTGRRRRSLIGGALAIVALVLLAADESEETKEDSKKNSPKTSYRAGHLVSIPLPITGTIDLQLKEKLDRLLDEIPPNKADAPRPVLILEFHAHDGKNGLGSQFERSLAVARYLSSGKLSRVRTVAYLPDSVFGHAVLPILACEEIVMHADAELGKAGADEEQIDDTMRNDYRTIADRRLVIPSTFAIGMLDKNVAVYKIDDAGTRFVLADELEKLRAEGKASEAETVTESGELPSFSSGQLRNYQLVSRIVADHKELAKAFSLAPRSLEGDPNLDGSWKAVQVEIRGRVDRNTVNWIQQSLTQQKRNNKPNFICISIDSPGGSPKDSFRLAFQLAELSRDDVRTVAYVPFEARADAALIALACDHVVMQGEAILGGPGAYQMRMRELDDARRTIRDLAKKKGRDWSLFAAMIDSKLVVHEYQRAGTGEVRYFCDEELKEQMDADRWEKGKEIKTGHGVNGVNAMQLELARNLAADFGELKQIYSLAEDPEVLRPAWTNMWVDQFASFLSRPFIGAMLLFAAWFFLSSEMAHPGLSAPGFAAALCFILFFWSQFLNGNAGWLEILLFGAGIVCLALEIFVIPGIGVFGIGGAIMIVISIVLASQSFVIPQNSYQLSQLPKSLSMVLAAIAGIIAAFVVMRKVLPNSPIFNHLMLQPPPEEELTERRQRESITHWEYLSGKRGKTTTQLTPSGKARFGDDVVDVISSGELIARDTDIYVAEVQGNHVLVKSLVTDDD